jgi:hypothetical protein
MAPRQFAANRLLHFGQRLCLAFVPQAAGDLV